MSQTKREGGQLKDFRWIHIPNQDELEKFYRATIENVKPDAKACGYAIGAHGSLRRDLDLIAVPWGDDHIDKDSLAQAIHEAACGLWETTYQWTQKPCGRWSTSLPICWLDYEDDRPSAGCIDLSVMPASVRPEVARITEAQLDRIEAHLIGKGTGRFASITYCHVCGNNIDYGHMENCAWAKVKTALSPRGTK